MTDDAMLYEWLREDAGKLFTTSWLWLVTAMFLVGAVFFWYTRRSRQAVVWCLFSAFVAGMVALAKAAELTSISPHYLVVWGAGAILLVIGGYQMDARRQATQRRRRQTELRHRARFEPARN